MGAEWSQQIRVHLSEALADVAAGSAADAALRHLDDVLVRHGASMRSQHDAFASYVAEAESAGPDGYPLYQWTKATLDDPVKAAKHARSFAVHVGRQEVYGQREADALAADLAPLVGGGLVTEVTRHDTNPANNLPIPPEYRS